MKFIDNENVIATSYTVGERVVTPFGMTFEVKENSELWNKILQITNFQEFVDKRILAMYPGDKKYDLEQEFLQKLKEDYTDSKLEIKIELKYTK